MLSGQLVAINRYVGQNNLLSSLCRNVPFSCLRAEKLRRRLYDGI